MPVSEPQLHQDLSRFSVPAGFRGRSGIVVLFWQLVQSTLFGLSPQPFYGWRRGLLRLFGARVGKGVLIRPTARVTYPWKVTLGDHCWIGDGTELYSLGPITIGAHAVISQKTYLCAGTHDPNLIDFPLIGRSIEIGPEAWIATDCFVAPGVTIGRGTIVAARSTVLKDLPPSVVAAGSPATVRRAREPAKEPFPKQAGTVSSDVVAIGQFPPPVSGFSHITACMVEVLRERRTVHSFDIAARRGSNGLAKHISRIAATARACVGLLRRRSSSSTCYIACEGELGLVYTLALVATARLAGYTIFLHHHSFAYIHHSRPLMRLLTRIDGDLTHVFLCEGMQRQFAARYGDVANGKVLSNAAFVAPLDRSAPPSGTEDTLIIGHLSNLTREKGLYIFLDLIRATVSSGQNVRAVLAGPVTLADDRAAIEEACRSLGDRLDFRGPVYGEEKNSFYSDVDVFIFPTQYINEAQPTVLFEAQAAGCKIASYDRGCIAAQVGTDGLLVPRAADFVATTLAWLRDAGPGLAEGRETIRARYAARHRHAAERASALLAEADSTAPR
jgi:acetyltransferase-like isoleucine patch superfamily enzyme